MNRMWTMAMAVFLCGRSLSTAQEAIPAQPAPFRTGVEVVSVEATVLDRQGQPLRGLAAKDFTVSVAGQPRRVVSAEFVDWTPAAPPGPVDPDGMPVSTNEGARSGRLFVFVVDQNTLEVGMARQVAAATSSFFRRLTSDDRSALMVMPVGPTVELTFAHDRVRDALQRVIGTNHNDLVWDNGSLTEARDIASHNMFALRSVAERECGRDITGAGGGGLATGPSTGGSPGAASGGETAGGGNSQGGSAGSGGGATSPPVRNTAGGASAAALGLGPQNECVRNIQMEADSLWRSIQAISLTTLASLHQVLSSLARVGGEKVVILISGGVPLDEHDQISLLSAVAADAAAARARVFTFFAPVSRVSASRRSMPVRSGLDEQIEGWSLDTLAGLTGGASFRVQVGAEAAFDRLGSELAGYYRLGVERAPSDLDGKARSLKVQVSSANTVVRTRTMFDARTYEDRDWSARLNAALSASSQATGLGLRLTSYVAADRDDPSRVRLVLAGEASRVADGDASFQLVIRDLQGKQVASEEQPLGAAASGRLPFSVNVPIAPGSYIVRMAVMDSAGHVGSVDHRADARKVPVGQLSAFGPLLVRLPPQPGATPVAALQGVEVDERLALQLDLQGQAELLAATDVLFEVASTLDGPALVTAEANVSRDAAKGSALAEGVAEVRLLPPGRYVARARVFSGGEPIGELRRRFEIAGAARPVAGDATPPDAVAAAPVTRANLAAHAAAAVPRFAIDQVLAPEVLGAFLDRVGARPDSSSPGVSQLLEEARTTGARELAVPDATTRNAPAASAFLKGLRLLANQNIEAAANEFRDAIRAAPDFYPAMVYLGACYAAGGRDREAAGAWQTALIRLGDTVAVHTLLSEALLREGKGDQARRVLDSARNRWPDDRAVNRLFATATIAAGRYGDGLDAVDELVSTGAQDGPLLELALLVLYEAFANGAPVVSAEQDRARMTRFADAYRVTGGPSLALVETWLSAAAPK